MWIVFVPAVCVISGSTMYRYSRSQSYSVVIAVTCSLLWLCARYLVLGHVPLFLTPQFKECVSTVNILLRSIRKKLEGKYSYYYPLIINLGLLRQYQLSRESHVPRYTSNLKDKQLAHYINFAAAAYGVVFYPKHVKSSFIKLLRTRTSSILTTVSENVISQMTSVPPEDIVLVRLKGENPLRPGYYIAVDDSTRTVVLVIRGTLTLSDALTDITCTLRDFLGGKAHHGISISAVNIFEDIQTILEAVLYRTRYDLVICGHSLGGGTAVLLTLYILHLRDAQTTTPALSKCGVHCYAFAPPPVYNGAQPAHWKESVTIIVNGRDVVPRISLANIYHLLQQLHFIDKLPISLWKRCNLLIGEGEECEGELLNLLSGIEHIRYEMIFEPLHHVGTLVWLEDQGLLVSPTETEFNNILIGTNFVYHHWPHAYQERLWVTESSEELDNKVD